MENDTFTLKSVTLDGKVSTISSINATTVVYDSTGNLFAGGGGGIWKIPVRGEAYRFSNVDGSKMAFGSDGFLYTVNAHRGSPDIMKISPDGKATVFFTGLSRPSGIVVSPSGEVYVADPGTQRIPRVDSSGKTTTIVQGLWTDPAGLESDKLGSIYFTAGWAGKVGYGLYKISLPDGSVRPLLTESADSGVIEESAIGDDGSFFLTSVTFGTLRRVTPDGKSATLVESWHNSRGMTIGPGGDIFVAGHSRFPYPGRVIRMDSKGHYSVFSQGFKYPKYLAFDASGNLFVSNTYGGGTWLTHGG